MTKTLFTVLARLPAGIRRPLVRFLIAVMLRVYARVRVHWAEPLPPGPLLFVSNHLSNIDGLILNRVLRAWRPVFLAGVKLQGTTLTRVATEAVDTIAVVPGSPDRQALKRAVATLQAGRSVLVFPEGGRSRTGGLIPGKPGVILLARMARVPVVPVALQGTEKVLPINDDDMEREWPRRATVSVRIGAAFHLADLSVDRGSGRDDLVAAIMARIAALLDPPYQGVYAPGHQV